MSTFEMENNSTDSTQNFNGGVKTYGHRYIDLILVPAYVLVIIVGLGGNSLVVIVVKKKRFMHTTTNYLLVNLAVADFLTLVWLIPGLVLSLVEHPSGVLGNFLCKFVTRHHFAGITQLVSGFTLTVLAAERYKALFHPLSLRLRLTRKNVRYPIALMWVFAITYVIPLFIFEEWNDREQFCEILWNSHTPRMVYWIILAVITIVASMIILYSYFNIIKGLYFTKTICSRGSAGSSTGSTQNGMVVKDDDKLEKRKIVKLLLIVTIIFFVCFMPFVVVSAIVGDGNSIAYKLCYFLVYCSSCLNPVVYAHHSSNFREAFGEILSNFSEKFKCFNITRIGSRSKMRSSLELRATYHHSQSDAENLQQPAKLLSVKKIDARI